MLRIECKEKEEEIGFELSLFFVFLLILIFFDN